MALELDFEYRVGLRTRTVVEMGVDIPSTRTTRAKAAEQSSFRGEQTAHCGLRGGLTPGVALV